MVKEASALLIAYSRITLENCSDLVAIKYFLWILWGGTMIRKQLIAKKIGLKRKQKIRKRTLISL